MPSMALKVGLMFGLKKVTRSKKSLTTKLLSPRILERENLFACPMVPVVMVAVTGSSKTRSLVGVTEDPLNQSASVRDGAFSILVGIAARKSCESGDPVKIAALTSLKPGIKRQFVNG